MKTRICIKCKNQKPLTKIFWRADGKYFKRKCKSCIKIWEKEYRQRNQKRIVQNLREYRKNNPEKVKECSHRYMETHKKEIKQLNIAMRGKRKEYYADYQRRNKARRNERLKMRRFKDTAFRLHSNLRTAIRNSVTRGHKRRHHWEDLVDWSFNDLKKHLEQQFNNGMTWENYGSYWHIDHKIPRRVFNFADPFHHDFKRCWALENLQPLRRIDNLQKSGKIKNYFQPYLRLEL